MSSRTQNDYGAYLNPLFVGSMTEAFKTLEDPSNAKLEEIHRVVHDLRDDRNNETNPLMKDIYNVLINRMTNLEVDVMGDDQVLLLCNRCLKAAL
jgi:hypothetical protein